MTDEVREYARKRIIESGIRIIHPPNFKCRGDVDLFIKMSSFLSMKGTEAVNRQEMCMTNKEVSAVFKDIYNGFWMKHRDNLPVLSDEAGWDAVVREAGELMDKHNCQLARNMMADLTSIMDQRQRSKERGEYDGFVSDKV